MGNAYYVFFMPMVIATRMRMSTVMGMPMTMCTGTYTIGKHATWDRTSTGKLISAVTAMPTASATCNFERLVFRPDPDALWVILGQRLQFQRCRQSSCDQYSRRARQWNVSRRRSGIKVSSWQKRSQLRLLQLLQQVIHLF